MTAFPLPPNFFRCPELSVDEKDYMINLAQKSLIDLVHHSRLEGGPIKWTLDSDEEGLQIYMGHDPTGVGSEMTFLCSTTEVMATLDEAASLFRSDTTDLFREYIRNFGKDMLDAQSLYTLTLPTPEHPRHYIGVKWMVLETPQGIMKNRDWCYLECQDDFVINGKRGWARSLNSIKLPCCPDLQESLGLVRASFYRTGFVFLETERPGYLRVVHAVQMDLKGKVPKFIVRIGARRRARSIADIDHFLREKRLSGEVFLDKSQLVALSARSKCFLCSKKFGAFTKKKSCRKCGEVVCSGCSKYWDINVNGLGRTMIRVCSACSVGTFNKGLPPLMSALTDNLSEQDSVEYGKRVVSHHSHQTPKMTRAFSALRNSGHEEYSMNITTKPQPIEHSNNYEPEPEPPLVAANRQLLVGSRAIKQEQPFEPAAAPLNRAVRYSTKQNDTFRQPREELPHSDNGSHNGATHQRSQNASYHSENESFDPRRYLDQNPRYQNQYQQHNSHYQDQPARYQQDPRYNPPRQQDSRYMDASFNDPRYTNESRYYSQKEQYMAYGQQNPHPPLRHVNEANEFNAPQMYPQERRPQYPDDRYRPPPERYQQSNSSDRDEDPSFSTRAYAPLNAQTLAAFTAQGSSKPTGEFMVDPYYDPRRGPQHQYEDDYYRYDQPQPRYYEDFRRPMPRRMNEYSYRNEEYNNESYRNGNYNHRYNPFDDYQYDNRNEGLNRYEPAPRRPPPQYNEHSINREQSNQDQQLQPEDNKQEKQQQKPSNELNALAEQMEALGLHLDPKKMTPQQLRALYTQLQKLNLDEPPKQA